MVTFCSLLLGVVFLTGCGQQPEGQNQPTTESPVAQQPATNQPDTTQQSPNLSVTEPALWQAYRNDRLGFEINIPKKVDNGPIQTIENGDALWVVSENGDPMDRYSKQFNSSVSDFERVVGIPWAMLVKTVNNDQELEQFIKDRYGKDCNLGEKQQSSLPGTFDVQVDAGNREPGEGCFLNWILFIKYSPEQHKVAAWDIGQDVNFATNADGTFVSYDFEMANSFKFIK